MENARVGVAFLGLAVVPLGLPFAGLQARGALPPDAGMARLREVSAPIQGQDHWSPYRSITMMGWAGQVFQGQAMMFLLPGAGQACNP